MLSTANSYLVSYATLKRTTSAWQVVGEKSVSVKSDAQVNLIAYYDYHLLAEETYADLNTLTVKVPEDETATNVVVVLRYAPEMEVAITRDAGGTITDAELATRTTALTTQPELWLLASTDTKGWYTEQARIRIHTGKANDVVKYGSSDAATATTNSAGDAYFYLTEINSDITITRDGVTVTLVPSGTAIEAGKAYVNTLAAGLQVVDVSAINASYTIPEGTKTLYIKGTTMGEDLSAALKNSEVTTLVLPDVTEIPQSFFLQCTALESVSAPKVTTIGQMAFYNCTALTSVTFGSVITSIGNNPFYNVSTGNCTLTLAPGQQQSATLAPSGNTWAGYTWKEIIIK